MLNFDSSLPLRNPGHYGTLLDAIYQAHASDETQWLEWKSELDLTSSVGRFAVAKEILAMSNRWPADMQSIGGRGVIVVGLSPGTAVGIPRIDPADLYQRLAPYLGDGVRWSAQWFEFKDVAVLVITVELPESGDPIYTLRKNFGSAIDGAIFVRSGTRAAPASSSQIRALTERSAPTLPEPALQIDVVVETDGPLKFVTWHDSVVEEWLARKARALLRPLDQPSPSLYGDLKAVQSIAAIATQASMWTTEPESRTEDEFREEVAHARLSAPERAKDALLGFLSPMLPATRIKVVNRAIANLTDLQVRSHTAGAISAYPRYDDVSTQALYSNMPRWPQRWGPKERPLMPTLAMPAPYIPSDFGPSTQIQNGGSFTLEFPGIDLRPSAAAVLNSDQEMVLIAPPNDDKTFEMAWHATASNRDAVAEGVIQIVFTGETLDLTDWVNQTLEAFDD